MRGLTSDEVKIRQVFSEILDLPSFKSPDWNLTSPELFELVIKKIMIAFDHADPFCALKQEQSQKASELYPWLESLVKKGPDPLSTAVNLAIIGNSLDAMWSDSPASLEPFVTERLKTPVPAEIFLPFKDRLQKSHLLLYVADNCGELVFDKLLVQTITSQAHPEIIFLVRSTPTLNDVTLTEARTAGLDSLATLTDNGIAGPLPGTILSRCSPRVRQLFEEADLVISKGGGNFDTIEEELSVRDKTAFLLMCKCRPYAQYFQTEISRPVLYTSF